MISVVIFTLNEEVHLPWCLEGLSWTDDVVVVDSFSVDRTEQICRERNIRFLQHEFGGFGEQRNWALARGGLKYEWVLILDADERVLPEFAAEVIAAVKSAPETVAAYRVRRRFHLWGRWLPRASLYPTWVVRLVRRGRVRYINRGHAETQEVDGTIRDLGNDLIDENRKGIGEWFERQNQYSSREAEYELEQERKPWRAGDLASKDPLIRRAAIKRLAARIPGRLLWYFFYTYFGRGGFLEGRDGFVLCAMRSIYQVMISIKKSELRRQSRT